LRFAVDDRQFAYDVIDGNDHSSPGKKVGTVEDRRPVVGQYNGKWDMTYNN
jgi:hypothetical protein